MFSGCKALTKVYMPNELNGFPEGLFNECSALEEIPFRAGIKVLPQYVFSKCTSLTSLVIPDTVQRIESNAASYCTSLSALVLPASLEYLADNAFEGCTSIHNIRIDQSNKIFFVNEEDGCLYEHTADGDKLRIATSQVQRQQVSFFKDNVDDESDDFFSDEDFDEIDETFSSSVSATDEEAKVLDATSALQAASVSEKESTEDPQALGLSDEEKALMMGDKPAAETPAEETQNQITQESTMEQNDQNVDGLLEDIMSEEKQRDTVSSDVLVDENETKVLSQMMDVMSDAPTETAESKVSDEELVNLLSPSEKPQKLDDTEQKIKILTQSVKKYQILEFNPQGELPAKTDLYVIAENLIQDEQGQDVFTPKLLRCCNTFAHIQNFKRVILLNGLPFENPEFENFYSGFMATKNIVLACEAQSPATLSEYAKKICSESRISLEKEELVTQRKRISTKNNSMIKLVIQDIYDN
jgi:hypothetical protein